MGNIYEGSETMKLLGQQYYDKIVTPELFKEIEGIIKANLESDRPDLKMLKYDIFVFGYLMGIRAERERRKQAGQKGKWTY